MRSRFDIDGEDARWWGDWVRPSDEAALYHGGAGKLYAVHLDRCTTPVTAADLLRVVADKPWATQQDLDDLRTALVQLTGFPLEPVAAIWPQATPYIELYAGGRQG